ncbi:MAG TPA: DUF5372 family protein [Streptosporangiaceae bacterium]|nr:DUF5372 family protein [Streptosporangiaceae bacterium]
MLVTHRFHPLSGRDFEFVAHRQNWAEDRVHLHDENGVLFSLSACGVPEVCISCDLRRRPGQPDGIMIIHVLAPSLSRLRPSLWLAGLARPVICI